MSGIEILREYRRTNGPIQAAIFDFDGTISTLRCGWEEVMLPLMVEMIGAPSGQVAEITQLASAYIDASTGIQTIHQMIWLRAQAARFGYRQSMDEWEYKAEYNRRLMCHIQARIDAVESGAAAAEDFMIAGAGAFLSALRAHGVALYLASGTDHADVAREAALLGVAEQFTLIMGAPAHEIACSKEAVIRQTIAERNIPAENLALIGDGKVEIALGAACGAFALGTATDETARFGVNKVKRERLRNAGAHAIVGDFRNAEGLLGLLLQVGA